MRRTFPPPRWLGADRLQKIHDNLGLRRIGSALLTLFGVYAVQYLSFRLFVSQMVPPQNWRQPFTHVPAIIYLGWDAAHYRHLYEVYNLYQWPPLYPFVLRLLTLAFRFDGDSFAKSALLLNAFSHAIIVLALAVYLQRDRRTVGIAAWLVAGLILFYPGHNVFFAAYSESLYLAVTVIVVLLRQNEKLAAASLVAGISALVRTMGTFLVAALLCEQIFYCIRDRQLHWRRLSAVLPGLAVVVAWNCILYVLGTSATGANASWTEELLKVHIGPGHEPRLWVLKYLTIGPHWELVAFWAGIAALIYCAIKKRYLEALYIGAFYSSLAFYVYRPFPWSRFISTLFPVQIMIADYLKEKPRATAYFFAVSVLVCLAIQIELFSGQIGEP